jgi:hypothetical protein
MSRLTGNPEFMRNLWLEAGVPRLLTMPALLGALFLFVGASTGLGDTLSSTALTAYAAIVFIWGNRLVANSVIQEVNNGTWDSQRMSAITPWAMTTGKLFGSTIYVWYGGLMCLGVYWLSQAGRGNDAELFQTTAIYLGSGLLSHIVSLIVSLAAIRKRRAQGRLRVWLYQFIGLTAAAPVIFYGSRSISGDTGLFDITWYGIPFTQFDFTATGVAIYVAWGIVGVYRMMRAELLSRNGQWVWLAFAVFTAIFVAGIGMPGLRFLTIQTVPFLESPHWRAMAVGSLTILSLAYVIAVIEPKSRFVVLLLGRYAAARRWRDFFDVLPRAAPTLAIALALIAGMTGWWLAGGDRFENANGVLRFIAIFLFGARDIGFIMLMSMWRSSPRADMTALVYLVVSYTVVPALLSVDGLYLLRSLFLPVAGGGGWLTVAPVAIEAVVVYGVLALAIRAAIRTETA